MVSVSEASSRGEGQGVQKGGPGIFNATSAPPPKKNGVGGKGKKRIDNVSYIPFLRNLNLQNHILCYTEIKYPAD